MNKRELINAVAERTGDKKVAAAAVDAVVGTIQDTVAAGVRVKVRRFPA